MNRMWMLLLMLCVAPASFPALALGADPAPPATQPGVGPVARVNSQFISRDRLNELLVEAYGKRVVEELVAWN